MPSGAQTIPELLLEAAELLLLLLAPLLLAPLLLEPVLLDAAPLLELPVEDEEELDEDAAAPPWPPAPPFLTPPPKTLSSVPPQAARRPKSAPARKPAGPSIFRLAMVILLDECDAIQSKLEHESTSGTKKESSRKGARARTIEWDK
jgi:hypothetical protein